MRSWEKVLQSNKPKLSDLVVKHFLLFQKQTTMKWICLKDGSVDILTHREFVNKEGKLLYGFYLHRRLKITPQWLLCSFCFRSLLFQSRPRVLLKTIKRAYKQSSFVCVHDCHALQYYSFSTSRNFHFQASIIFPFMHQFWYF